MRNWIPGAAALAAVLAAGCAAVDAPPVQPREAFSRACAVTGEAHVQVLRLRRAGRIDVETFRALDDAYDAAVETCATLPPTDAAAEVAMAKVGEFLARAGGVTGATYSY